MTYLSTLMHKNYAVHVNPGNQQQLEVVEGKLIAVDEGGFVVLEDRDGNFILIKKDLVDRMVQIPRGEY